MLFLGLITNRFTVTILFFINYSVAAVSHLVIMLLWWPWHPVWRTWKVSQHQLNIVTSWNKGLDFYSWRNGILVDTILINVLIVTLSQIHACNLNDCQMRILINLFLADYKIFILLNIIRAELLLPFYFCCFIQIFHRA